MITLATEWNEAAAETAQLVRLSVRTPRELIGMRFDDTDNYFGDRILAAGQPCTLLGPGGVGKSRLSLQSAVCMILGLDFVGFPTRAEGKRWLFIQTENSNRRLHYDLMNIVSALQLNPEQLTSVDENLVIHTLEKETDLFLNLLNQESYGIAAVAAISTITGAGNPNRVPLVLQLTFCSHLCSLQLHCKG